MILLWVAWPIMAFSLSSEHLFGKLISPLSESGKVDLALATSEPEVQGETMSDLTNANSWFPTAPQKKVVTPVNSYRISIPKLKIENALVIIAGDDLSKGLVHYGGTGLPGEYGTAVIFGHSTLPQFFSTTNYKSIFSTLPTLKAGDDIWVDYDSVKYHYLVEELVMTEPTDLSPLAQRFDDSYLTLVTCVPPGTYWKRLNVHARLERI